MVKPLPPQKRLRELFEYVDGTLIRKTAPNGRVKVGDRAGWTNAGRRHVEVDDTPYLEHRIIFQYHFDNTPDTLDHIDGDPLNNRIENLRPASRSENGYNRKAMQNNTSGYKGVSECMGKRGSTWLVSITKNGKQVKIGRFKDKIDAAQAYNLAAGQLHGPFVCYNGLVDSDAYGLF